MSHVLFRCDGRRRCALRLCTLLRDADRPALAVARALPLLILPLLLHNADELIGVVKDYWARRAGFPGINTRMRFPKKKEKKPAAPFRIRLAQDMTFGRYQARGTNGCTTI